MAANRAVDDFAINTCGLPGDTLMKNAGLAVVQEMDQHGYLNDSPSILILSGHGNNGGDGYVVAADLIQRGFQVDLIRVASESSLKGDALHHYLNLKSLGQTGETWRNTPAQNDLINNATIIVDALLGTGIKGSIRAPYDDLINACNTSQAAIIAVDVPSGVTGDLGSILEPCIRANLTVSMGFGKQGCLFEPARSQSGKIVPVDIGFPDNSLDQLDETVLNELERWDFPASAFTRFADTHKYTAGKVYIIAGSRGYTGAALLAASAALRSGAGLVKLAIPESLGNIAETLSMETIVEYLPETETHSFAEKALLQLKDGGEWADCVALGPGLGRHGDTMNLARELIGSINKPLVIDADALFCLTGHLDLLKNRSAPTLITPHHGEFKRLISAKREHVPTWEDATKFAQEFQVHVLLKGAPSLIAAPDGKVFINSTGNPGMATAGSGDVLTGVCASLWSQWPQLPEVLSFSMFIHGKAADLGRADKGVLGLNASDIVEVLPHALKVYGDIPN